VGGQLGDPGVDRGHGGLVPGEQQPRSELGGFVEVEALRVGAVGGHQRREDVVAGLVEPGRDEVAQVLPEPAQSGEGALPVDHVADVARPLAELLAVGVGDPEQLADHQGGQRERHGLVEVHRWRALRELVEQSVDGALDAGAHRAHRPGAEPRQQELAHARVLGDLGRRGLPRAPHERRLREARGAVRIGVAAAEPPVGHQGADGVVVGHQPGRVAGR
jgi:hypothetical protein